MNVSIEYFARLSKAIIKLIAPPILLLPVEVFRNIRDEPRFEYAPLGWETPFQVMSDAWQAPQVASSREKEWHMLLETCASTAAFGADRVKGQDLIEHNRVMSFCSVVARCAENKKRIKLIDWGGGTGDYYKKAQSIIPNIEIEYHCKELPLTTEIGKKLNSEVVWHDDEDSWMGATYDMVFSSGAFYYVKDWKGILKKLASVGAKYIYLTRTPVVENDNQSFVIMQRSSFEYKALLHILNKLEIVMFLEEQGYTLEREFLTGEVPVIKNSPCYVESKGWLFVQNL